MTSRERVLATFSKEPTDKVPIHHLGFSSEVASALLGREAFVGGGIQMWREAVAWFVRTIPVAMGGSVQWATSMRANRSHGWMPMRSECLLI